MRQFGGIAGLPQLLVSLLLCSACSFDLAGESLSDSQGSEIDAGPVAGDNVDDKNPPKSGEQRPRGRDIPITSKAATNPAIDVLFVIDDGVGMQSAQHQLVDQFAEFVATLVDSLGDLPNLHVGVVSTDVGVGARKGVCNFSGKLGRLLSHPRGSGCGAVDGDYLRDVRLAADIRSKNYSGTLVSAFACISQLGEEGCAFPEPLEAMRIALHDNAGDFLREDAFLVVIFVTNKDDCSSEIGRDNLPPTGSAGFRCFRDRVVCAPDRPVVPGTKSDCVPRERGTWADVANYLQFLDNLKPDGRFLVSGIYGETEPIEVELASQVPFLKPSCVGAGGSALPAVRLEAFRLAASGAMPRIPICVNSREALVPLAERVVTELVLGPAKK